MGTLDLLDSTFELETKGEIEVKGGLEEKLAERNQGNLSPVEPSKREDTTNTERPTLSESVRESVERYISAMDDQEIVNLYELVLSEVEAPLLESVLNSTHNNQSKTAMILGLNRGTLRKKLRKYGML